MNVAITKRAADDLLSLPGHVRTNISKVLKDLLSDPKVVQRYSLSENEVGEGEVADSVGEFALTRGMRILGFVTSLDGKSIGVQVIFSAEDQSILVHAI